MPRPRKHKQGDKLYQPELENFIAAIAQNQLVPEPPLYLGANGDLRQEEPLAFDAEILSGSNPYAWREKFRAGAAWHTLVGGRSGTTLIRPAYEYNNISTVPVGSIVLMGPGYKGQDYSFPYITAGSTTPPPPPPCGQICFHVKGCGGLPLPGATVNLTGPAGFTATNCTTGTSPAGQCCIAVSPGGTYHYSIIKTGFVGTIGSVTVPCTATLTTNINVTLAVDTTNYFCSPGGACCPDPIAQSATFHANDGTTTTPLTFGSGAFGSGWYGAQTFSATIVEVLGFSGWVFCFYTNKSNGAGGCLWANPPGGNSVDGIWYFDGCRIWLYLPTCDTNSGGVTCRTLCLNDNVDVFGNPTPCSQYTALLGTFVDCTTHTYTGTFSITISTTQSALCTFDSVAYFFWCLYPSGTVTFSFAP